MRKNRTAPTRPIARDTHTRILEPLFQKDKLFYWVLALSLAVVLFNILCIHFVPTSEGDSFEYAGLARNFLKYGDLRTTHVNIMFPFADQVAPQPSVFRATLWTFVILPFQALLGTSIWSFIIPFQITVFLLGPAVYLLAWHVFDRKIAFAAAVAVILNPRILTWASVEDPGQSAIFAAFLFLISVLLFIKRRWAWAGVATGITVLTKLNGLILIPLFVLWLLLFDRKELFRKGLYVYLACAAIFGSPFFIRSAVVFGDPLYSILDSSRYQSREHIRHSLQAKRENAEIWYAFDNILQENGGEHATEPPMSNREYFLARAEFQYYNIRGVLLGNHTGLTWYPGYLETLTLVLLPFLFIGAWGCRGDPKKLMLVLFLAVHLGTLMIFKSLSEDRYLFPSLAVGAVLAMYGVALLAERFRVISISRILVLFILIETVPTLGLMGFKAFKKSPESEFKELRTMCEWIRTRTPEDTMIMAVPFWSPQYFTDRRTVPPPIGGMDRFKKTVDMFKVDYFLFSEHWGGDRMPRFRFMQPILRGKFYQLYRIDRTHPDFVNLHTRYAYMEDFDILGYFYRDRFVFDSEPSLFKSLYTMTKNAAAAAALFLAMCVAAYLIICIPIAWVRRPAYLLLFMGLMFCKLSALEPIRQFVHLTPPPVSKYQAAHFLEKQTATRGQHALRITGAGDQKALMDTFNQIGLNPAAEDLNMREISSRQARTPLFVPLQEKTYYINSMKRARAARELFEQENRNMDTLEKALRRAGYETEPVSGGILAFPEEK